MYPGLRVTSATLCLTITGKERVQCRECLHAEEPAIGAQQCTHRSTLSDPITCPMHCSKLQRPVITLPWRWKSQISHTTHTASWPEDSLLPISRTLVRANAMLICDLPHTTQRMLYCAVCNQTSSCLVRKAYTCACAAGQGALTARRVCTVRDRQAIQ